jgi:Raf kinase inhibitor-like YbhB/YbcL family protein
MDSVDVVVFVMSPGYAADFRLTSPSIKEQGTITNEQVFSGMGCSGKNVSPELYWDNIPENTKSFAVTVYDPDAPTGSGWWHWVVFNIPARVHMLPANAGKSEGSPAVEGAIQSMTDFGRPGYGGPCPPPGDNRIGTFLRSMPSKWINCRSKKTPQERWWVFISIKMRWRRHH